MKVSFFGGLGFFLFILKHKNFLHFITTNELTSKTYLNYNMKFYRRFFTFKLKNLNFFVIIYDYFRINLRINLDHHRHRKEWLGRVSTVKRW